MKTEIGENGKPTKDLFFTGDYQNWDDYTIDKMLQKVTISICGTKLKKLPQVPDLQDRADIRNDCFLWLARKHGKLSGMIKSGDAGMAIQYMRASLNHIIFESYKNVVMMDEMEINVGDVSVHIDYVQKFNTPKKRFTPEEIKEIAKRNPHQFYELALKVGTEKQLTSYYFMNIHEAPRTASEQAAIEKVSTSALIDRLKNLIDKVILMLIFDDEASVDFIKTIKKANSS